MVSEALLNRRASTADRIIFERTGPSTSSSQWRLAKSKEILEAGEVTRKRFKVPRYKRLEDGINLMAVELSRRRSMRKKMLKRMDKRKEEKLDRERSREMDYGGLSPGISPREFPFMPYVETEEKATFANERNAWIFDRQYAAASAPVMHMRKPRIAVPDTYIVRPKTTCAEKSHYTDHSVDWGSGKSIFSSLSRSSSPDHWQRSPARKLHSACDREYRDPIPRKYLWSKEQALAGRVASWDAEEAVRFWQGWNEHSGLAKALSRAAMAKAEKQKAKQGKEAPSTSPNKKTSSSSGTTSTGKCSKKGGGPSSGGSPGGRGRGRTKKRRRGTLQSRCDWDDRCFVRVPSLENECRPPFSRSYFLPYSEKPERYMDKMTGRLIRDELTLTEEERKARADFERKAAEEEARKAQRMKR
ncbi:unnamed protein product [Amoebophrya sp. A25]|nr:unnamed protein product [Amoebophrya sp. A25]|eukprot:GSA25T00023114001.1